jgi:hypothetical protein
MKALRFVIVVVAVFGSIAAFATNARVESMGKSTRFIMDDMSIFDNPANMNLYPNFLIGELGVYNGSRADAIGSGQNHDPWDPWFGGLFSLDIGGGNALSIGGILGRKEERLLKYFPDYIFSGTGRDQTLIETPIPVTNFDGFLGANFSGTAIGLHIYLAHQDGKANNGQISSEAFASALQLDAGINVEISSDYQLELSGGVARIQYGPSDHDLFDDKLFSGFASARLFSKISAIDGHFIPVASLRNMNAPGRKEMDVSAGLGVDTKFDRGFFWLGLTGFYNVQEAGQNWYWTYPYIRNTYKVSDGFVFNDPSTYDSSVDDFGGSKATLKQTGGTISFGIERNIWWDWFVLRVGGQKTIAYAEYKTSEKAQFNILCPSVKNDKDCKEDGNYFATNPVNDGTRDDNVGFGFGINIEEKLKVDASVAEDLLFRNPFQGGGRLLSRISATYSF